MPSPIAHVGLALAAQLALLSTSTRLLPGRALLRDAAAVAFAAIAPDLDILAVILLPGGIAWHRGPSHSLLGATLIGALVAWAARVRGAAAWAAVVLAAVVHVPLDWSTGERGAPSAFGVPFFWPFDATKAISADPWFGAYHIDRAGFLANMFAPEALPVYGKEVATVLVATALAGALRALRSRAPAAGG